MSLVMEIGAERESIATFADIVEGATSLATLRKIDKTVDSLGDLRKVFAGLAKQSRMLADQVADLTPQKGVYFDADDVFITSLKSSYEGMESHIPKLLRMKASVDHDGELKLHHCDLLHTAFDEAISATGEFVESLKDLRAAIIRFDLAAEPRDGESFDSADELISSLRSN